MIYTEQIQLKTKGFGDTIDITARTISITGNSKIENGLVTIFCPGSTCTITTIEYESGVIRDLQRVLEKIAPSNADYEHNMRWGDGNGFSHVRAALMKPGLSVPMVDGNLMLGTWQQIVFMDFDNRERNRAVIVQVMGI